MNTSKRPGTISLARPVGISFGNGKMTVELSDGRTLGVPLDWFPRLQSATPEQLQKYELSPFGLHWEDLDEDISITGLLAGRGDRTRRMPRAAE